MIKMKFTLFSTLLAIHASCSLCRGYELMDVINLKQQLFNGTDYDSSIRPIENQSQILQVSVSLAFSAIVNFTVTSGTLRMLSLLMLSWKDEQLTWNSSDYGGLNRISINSDVLWTPTLIQLTEVGYEFPVSPAWVYATGDVLLIRAGELSGFCDIDMTCFPYDVHECKFDLISVIHSSDEMSLKALIKYIDLEMYIKSGQWDILDTQSHVFSNLDPETNISADFFANRVKVRRKPQFLILHIVIPMALILILNIFVYIVPVDSGERISISVTLLLTMVFFTTDLSDTIPESSDNISLLSMLMVAVNTSSAVSVAVSVVLCRIVTRSNKPVPKVLTWLTRLCKRDSKVLPIGDQSNVKLNNRNDEDATIGTQHGKERPSNRTQDTTADASNITNNATGTRRTPMRRHGSMQQLSIIDADDKFDDDVDEHVENTVAFQRKPRNCSSKQAAVTRSSLKSGKTERQMKREICWMDVAKCIDFILCSLTCLFVLVVCCGFIGVLVNVHFRSFKYGS